MIFWSGWTQWTIVERNRAYSSGCFGTFFGYYIYNVNIQSFGRKTFIRLSQLYFYSGFYTKWIRIILQLTILSSSITYSFKFSKYISSSAILFAVMAVVMVMNLPAKYLTGEFQVPVCVATSNSIVLASLCPTNSLYRSSQKDFRFPINIRLSHGLSKRIGLCPLPSPFLPWRSVARLKLPWAPAVHNITVLIPKISYISLMAKTSIA
jgi:hypothetical protein